VKGNLRNYMDATYTPESERSGNVLPEYPVLELTDAEFELLKNQPHDGPDLPDAADDDL